MLKQSLIAPLAQWRATTVVYVDDHKALLNSTSKQGRQRLCACQTLTRQKSYFYLFFLSWKFCPNNSMFHLLHMKTSKLICITEMFCIWKRLSFVLQRLKAWWESNMGSFHAICEEHFCGLLFQLIYFLYMVCKGVALVAHLWHN